MGAPHARARARDRFPKARAMVRVRGRRRRPTQMMTVAIEAANRVTSVGTAMAEMIRPGATRTESRPRLCHSRAHQDRPVCGGSAGRGTSSAYGFPVPDAPVEAGTVGAAGERL